MNRDAPSREAQTPVGGFRFGQLVRHIAVFDDVESPARKTEMAEFLVGVALARHLARHLAPRVRVKADKDRVERWHERVIGLEVTDMLDAARRHVLEHSGPRQRAEGSAVAVGGPKQSVSVGENQFPLKIDGGHHALREELDVAARQVEIVPGLEKVAGGAVVNPTGHDVPGNRHTVSAVSGEDAVGKDLEKGPARNGADLEGPFRAVVAEPRPLAAGDGQRRHPACCEGLFPKFLHAAALLAFRIRFWQRYKRGRLEVLRQFRLAA